MSVSLVIAGLIVLASLSASARDYARVPSDSPVSWHAASDSPSIARDRAVAIASAALGVDVKPATTELVRFTDRDPFGESLTDRLAWLVRFGGVELRRPMPAETCTVDVTLVVGADNGRVLEAFTPVREPWFRPFSTPRAPEHIANKTGWTIAPLMKDAPSSSIVAVLNESWCSSPNPALCGQIVARPRHVDNQLPARLVDDELVSIWQPAIRWLVQVLGTDVMEMNPPPSFKRDGTLAKAKENTVPYFTGSLILIDDATCTFIMATGTD